LVLDRSEKSCDLPPTLGINSDSSETPCNTQYVILAVGRSRRSMRRSNNQSKVTGCFDEAKRRAETFYSGIWFRTLAGLDPHFTSREYAWNPHFPSIRVTFGTSEGQKPYATICFSCKDFFGNISAVMPIFDSISD
jgi:hypothetical protein